MTPDLFWIPNASRGTLVIVARPRGGDWLEDEARGWKGAGIDDEADQLGLSREAEAATANGIRFISFPIPDRGVPASTSAAVSLIASIHEALERRNKVAVHCRQSVGRSGLIATGILTASDLTPERAIEAVSAARGETVPETPEQRRWIERLPFAAAHNINCPPFTSIVSPTR